ncbi:ATP-binding protein [Salipaludibacillus daqingensis]|uniref:ATP-binding protein n=1 Tax=Salipaludibacillus daqingensis TaxID=3041001 RepID=UPI002473D26C|nr:ATP-binding protein [Salipaludibacillus daqingensis]
MKSEEPHFITKANQLCKESGMDPNVIASPKILLSDQEMKKKRHSYNEILSVVRFFSKKLLKSLEGTPILVVISDSEGYLLEMEGDETIKLTVEQFGIKSGSLFRQEDTGTNVISLALQHRQPISLIGDHHYHTFLHEVACYGAAFHYTDDDNLLGSVCIMMPIKFQNPLYITMLSQVVDSIERELLLRKQNHKLHIMNQIMLSRTRNGIVITDEHGVTTEFNEFAEEISNRSRESVIGRSIYESELTGHFFKKVLEKEEKFEDEELNFINQNGDQIVCLFDAQPIYRDHKVIGAFGQFRDITENVNTRERLFQSDRLSVISELSASVSHEIRNPLTVTSGFLQLLNRSPNVDVKEKGYIELSLQELNRAEKIVSDFLSLSKPQAQNMVYSNLKVEIEYVNNIMIAYANLHQVKLDFHFNNGLCNNFDQNQIQQCLINLYKNGIESMSETGGILTVHIEEYKGNIIIFIKDSGVGMTKDEVSRMGDPYYSTKEEGTGLGMLMVYSTVYKHGGKIDVNSEKHKGTTFQITFPGVSCPSPVIV